MAQMEGMATGLVVGVVLLCAVVDEALEDKPKPCCPEDDCDELFDECLENPWQPDWNVADYGSRKPCIDCYWICKREGKWPTDKCSRSWA